MAFLLSACGEDNAYTNALPKDAAAVFSFDLMEMCFYASVPTIRYIGHGKLSEQRVHSAPLPTFAVMYPDAQVWFYGVIPLKAKWLAWADIALMAWNIARSVRYGAYASALAAVVAILNFVIFFWEDIKSILGIQSRQRSRQTIQFKSAVRQQKKAETERGYRHKCEVCGRTDADHPELEFRYCSKCQGYHCFCSDHIFDHQHFTK